MSQGSFSVEINPAVLKWARSAAGQTIADVAEHLDISAQVVHQWENGKKTPAWNTLRKLARCYHRPIAALLLAEPPDDPGLPPDFRTLPDAKRQLSAGTLLTIRTARWLQSRAMEMQHHLQPYPQFSVKKAQITHRVDELADVVRKALGIEMAEQTSWNSPYEAYRRWRESLEEAGTLIFQFPFPVNELRGFSLFDTACPVVVVNESDDMRARIFTMFHEYAHMLLQKPGMCIPEVTAEAHNNEVEAFCNRFAANLLVPDTEVTSWQWAAGEATARVDSQLRVLAARYQVSKYVVLFRLRSLDLISQRASNEIERRWKKETREPTRPRKRISGGPSAVQICRRQRGTLFVSLVLEAAKRDLITTRDAVTYLGIKAADLKKLAVRR